MKIRPATAADIPAILMVEKQAVGAAHWSLQQYERVFAREFSDNRCAVSGTLTGQPAESFDSVQGGRRRYQGLWRVGLVVEHEAAVRGFLVGHALESEWEIENMGVAGSVLRRGVGSLLLKYFLDLARAEGATTVLLEVRESNFRACRLYEKFLFNKYGRRKHYYSNPQEDAVLYGLVLNVLP